MPSVQEIKGGNPIPQADTTALISLIEHPAIHQYKFIQSSTSLQINTSAAFI